jgi:hypothetical protein
MIEIIDGLGGGNFLINGITANGFFAPGAFFIDSDRFAFSDINVVNFIPGIHARGRQVFKDRIVYQLPARKAVW